VSYPAIPEGLLTKIDKENEFKAMIALEEWLQSP